MLGVFCDVVRSIETIEQAIQGGAGVCILPEPTGRREAVPFALADLRRSIGIVYRQCRILAPTMNRCIDLLREEQGTPVVAGHSAAKVPT
ncbi:MAG TPA: LysR substrate-binding domain-containing protein [Phycisphaerae bacterium]|nr:LysR substrate-binding domain-containing protein [Phycisphaerae bacterium]